MTYIIQANRAEATVSSTAVIRVVTQRFNSGGEALHDDPTCICWFLPEVAGHAGLKIRGTSSSLHSKKHARRKRRWFVYCSLGRP